jgi:hypothetical protein
MKTAREVAEEIAYFGSIRSYDEMADAITQALDRKQAVIDVLREGLKDAWISYVAMSESTEENGLPPSGQELINMCDSKAQMCGDALAKADELEKE